MTRFTNGHGLPDYVRGPHHTAPLSLLPDIRGAIREIDPNLAPLRPMTPSAQFEQSYTPPMLFARLAMAFGALAVALVATGLNGTLTYCLQRPVP